MSGIEDKELPLHNKDDDANSDTGSDGASGSASGNVDVTGSVSVNDSVNANANANDNDNTDDQIKESAIEMSEIPSHPHTPMAPNNRIPPQELSEAAEVVTTPAPNVGGVGHDESHEGHDSHGSCFFADATLDLEDARCIEETPDMQTRKLVLTRSVSGGSTYNNGNNGNNGIGNNSNNNIKNPDAIGMNAWVKDKGGGGKQLLKDFKLPLALPLNNLQREKSVTEQSIQEEQGEDEDEQQQQQQQQDTNGNTINEIHPQRIVHNATITNLAPTTQPRPPRRPRDTNYIVFFFIAIPLLFFLPCTSLFINDILISYTTFPTVSTTALACVLCRFLYCSRGGDEGDDHRYTISTILFIANLVSCLSMPIATLQIYYLNVTKYELWWYPPLVYLLVILCIREVYIFAKLFKSNRNGNRSGTSMNVNNIGGVPVMDLSEDINDGQRTMFRMLVNVALDILSRSLRPMNMFRFVVGCSILQLGIVHIAKRGSLCALSLGGFGLMSMIAMIGFWLISAVMKMMALVCSGGVTIWFAQQSLLMEQMERMRQSEEGDLDDDNDDESNDGDILMPEAYRDVNANAYSSVIEFDEGMDDDFENDEDDGLTADMERQSAINGGGSGSGRRDWQNASLKTSLFYGGTISLGSVLQCALFGPISDRISTVIYYIDLLISFITESRGSNRSRRGRGRGQETGFQGMTIPDADSYSYLSCKEKVYVSWKRLEGKAQSFIKNNNDLGLCHVAAYHKSYQRASNDVMTLMNASGTSSIINDDISSHMCTSISKAISIVIVILLGQPLSLRSSGLNHSVVCEIMVTTYLMCYLILNTMMEPLRASIKAVYVSFAQHPQSLSQAFPLLYHRLSRISEE